VVVRIVEEAPSLSTVVQMMAGVGQINSLASGDRHHRTDKLR